MDRPPPYQRPPDRPMNHHPQTTQAYPGYPPASQPQQPLHVPYTADPYSMPRRDPFFPSGPHHVRRSSQGLPAGNNAPQGQHEGQGQGGWSNSGTDYTFHNRLKSTCAQHTGRGSVYVAWTRVRNFCSFYQSQKVLKSPGCILTFMSHVCGTVLAWLSGSSRNRQETVVGRRCLH
jgi:hypothetical protein